ncbi:xanthine dehydrogenase accessory protein XdhC [Sulfitobacter sp. SK012]|uniref:xanthine dehydrogenase accessory protein XdhC n=1 Tax=Sulfitobacter sp. SK012 TaxID=1389005 RepID=UPI000E0A20C7|nr:xanthine dehydrogenase accessory protein XdhC [Sulfitobacter sp. SK012]AXI47818.1 xanthine dehydrogenase accessory protein XdhC [Sulfitobacter sp. SK012]
MSHICIEITATRGSAPRDAGTAMIVRADRIVGTIGGGALEYRAITTARKMLNDNQSEAHETIPLGPDLGQCCGGAVSLRYSRDGAGPNGDPSLAIDLSILPETPLGPLWIWGAGHVGRAMVNQIAPLDAFAITWVDATPDRFPANVPAHIDIVPTLDMPRLAAHAPTEAHHLILTYSHDIDLKLCAALLERGFASCGLIGSATKWARFSSRLKALGLEPAQITCPIGDPSLGKHPAQIAHGTALTLLKDTRQRGDTGQNPGTKCHD